MTVHQCPKCELRFTWQTELDDHCRTDHPKFHHEYPVGGVHHVYDEAAEKLRAEKAAAARESAKPEHVPTRAERTFGRPPERAW